MGVELGILMIGGGVAAGFVGALLGLGGGILLVPLLTIGFDLPFREAVGVSLVSIIVTSGASAAVYLDRGVANLRLGMTLELFSAIGGIIGATVAFLIAERALAALFAGLLGYVAISMWRRGAASDAVPIDSGGSTQRFGRPATAGEPVRHLRAGAAASVGAGVVANLLGIGAGMIKVPTMHLLMGVPLRVATATSNVMIGVTATSGALIYLLRGGIDPNVAGPTAIGAFFGAALGSRVAHRVGLGQIRWLFIAVLGYSAVQMAIRAATGGSG